ncbi:response regulator transcription factor [Pseudomonas sp. NW5]|uniref:LuxR C-terminal-related transcriptional regulator n=1 Tax=Pseudomonas sp. NW5 TaxID=2934934 RepID=UPI0020206B9A|nr:response regulator transcription factor [Pseudomonas sp. NW5]MCL7462321.1 response regulator transcription factor [Pseudomonas sp. NW5]
MSHTLLIVDSDREYAHQLAQFLREHGLHCQVCHTAEAARAHYLADATIDILLSAHRPPQLDGIQLLSELRQHSGMARPQTAILYSAQAERNTLVEAMRAGFCDYFDSPIDEDALLAAIARLADELDQRQRLLSLCQRLQDMSQSLQLLHGDLQELLPPPRATAGGIQPLRSSADNDLSQLSPRQLAVARLVARGLTNYQIACELGITENTVKLYVSQILRLTRMHNRTQLAMAQTPGA